MLRSCQAFTGIWNALRMRCSDGSAVPPTDPEASLLVPMPRSATSTVDWPGSVVWMRRIERPEFLHNEFRDRQLLITNCLHDAFRKLVAAVIVVMRVVDVAAGRGERTGGFVGPERFV